MDSTKCAVRNGMTAGEASGSMASPGLDLDALAGELERLDRDIGAGGLQAGTLELDRPRSLDLPGHDRLTHLVEEADADIVAFHGAYGDRVVPLEQAIAGFRGRDA